MVDVACLSSLVKADWIDKRPLMGLIREALGVPRTEGRREKMKENDMYDNTCRE